MWKKEVLPLTKDQKERGVIFSSALYADNGTDPEVQEVMLDDPRRDEKIRNLKDVSFFKGMAKDFGWSVVEVIHCR